MLNAIQTHLGGVFFPPVLSISRTKLVFVSVLPGATVWLWTNVANMTKLQILQNSKFCEILAPQTQ